MKQKDKVYASIVYYNSLNTHGDSILSKALDSFLNQEEFIAGKNLIVRLCDNASTDNTYNFLKQISKNQDIYLQKNESNLGFSGAHNQAVFKFLQSNCDYFLLLNPDLYLNPDFLLRIIPKLEQDKNAGLATPKLYRGDPELNLTKDKLLDAAGMYLTNSLRHFDRGSNEKDTGEYDSQEYVFGGTGACLMFKREAVEKLILPENKYQADLYKIYPELEEGRSERRELLDESFFAYREDADVCWRAFNKGIKCLYVPEATGIHKRVVLPDNRKNLDATLNYLSVRNRFLLQINNYSFFKKPAAFFVGIIFRNLLVILGVALIERSSFRAFKDLMLLYKRTLKNRELNSS